MGDPPSSWTHAAAKHWATLAQFATVAMGIAGSFVLPPPSDDLDGDVWRPTAAFVLAVLAGGFFVLTRRLVIKRHASRWAGTALVLLLISVALNFIHSFYRSRVTELYQGHRVVVGTNYLPDIVKYIDGEPNTPSRAVVLWDAAGDVKSVWPSNEVEANRLRLASIYVTTLTSVVLTVMSIVQALHCISIARKNGA